MLVANGISSGCELIFFNNSGYSNGYNNSHETMLTPTTILATEAEVLAMAVRRVRDSIRGVVEPAYRILRCYYYVIFIISAEVLSNYMHDPWA